MKQFLRAALVLLPLTFAIAGCQKAHKAGNDSMSTGHTHIVARAGTAEAAMNHECA